MENREYSYCAEWLADQDVENQYKPIDAMLYRCCSKQKTSPAMDCITVTETGKTIQSQNYEDYRQEAYANLLEIAVNDPLGDFRVALFQAVTSAMDTVYKNNGHHRKQIQCKDGKTYTIWNDPVSIDSYTNDNDDDITPYDRIATDSYSNPETTVIENMLVDTILREAETETDKQILIMIGLGYDQKEISVIANIHHGTVRKKWQRIREDVIAKEDSRRIRAIRQRQRQTDRDRRKHEANEDAYNDFIQSIPEKADVISWHGWTDSTDWIDNSRGWIAD